MAAIADFNTPELVTKNLAFNRTEKTPRKLRVSSNFLALMGYRHGDRLAVEPASRFGGFSVVKEQAGTHKVHARAYKNSRSNSPFETLIEFGSQTLIDNAFAPSVNRFHTQITRDKIIFTPLINRAAAIVNRFKKQSPLKAFVALTGGVDAHCLESLGFDVDVALDFRVQEKRDNTDKTEVNLLSAVRNSHPKVLLSEDIYHLELNQLENVLADRPPIGLAHYSLQCDDWSLAKSSADKALSLENLSTTIDMFVPMLEQIKVIQPAAIVIENVIGFGRSQAGSICMTQLRRLGYHVHALEMDARDYGGVQSRKRSYIVATITPGFIEPGKTPRNTASIWPRIDEFVAECRDVSHTNFIKNRATSNRATPSVTEGSCECPTILKSNSRGIKDGTYLETKDGKILAPSESVIKRLMSIPDRFDTSWMGSELAVEVLGQSIDYAMHETLLASVRDYLDSAFGGVTVLNYRQRQPISHAPNHAAFHAVMDKPLRRPESQLGFRF